MPGAGGVLVGANHTGIDPDRPPRALGEVRVAAQFIEDPNPRLVA